MDFWNSEHPARCLAKILCVTLAVVFVATGASQAPTQVTTAGFEEPPTAQDSPTVSAVDPAVINEIMAIRQQLGGGLTKNLEGLSLGDEILGENGNFDSLARDPMNDVTTGFKDALQSILSADGPPKILDPSVCGIPTNTLAVLPINGKLATNPCLAYFSTPANSDGDAPPLVSSKNSQKTRQCLRNVARQLDSLAADLEDVEQYETAGRLRLEARSFREQARHANNWQSPSPARLR